MIRLEQRGRRIHVHGDRGGGDPADHPVGLSVLAGRALAERTNLGDPGVAVVPVIKPQQFGLSVVAPSQAHHLLAPIPDLKECTVAVVCAAQYARVSDPGFLKPAIEGALMLAVCRQDRVGVLAELSAPLYAPSFSALQVLSGCAESDRGSPEPSDRAALVPVRPA